jgi:hypothetical protein
VVHVFAKHDVIESFEGVSDIFFREGFDEDPSRVFFPYRSCGDNSNFIGFLCEVFGFVEET